MLKLISLDMESLLELDSISLKNNNKKNEKNKKSQKKKSKHTLSSDM